MTASWPDEVDRVLEGDLTAGVAYVTPAGGSVVTAVAPIGLRDREGGTVGFTTSLGLSRKLERIAREPRVALAYHARKHGFYEGPGYVLVQGDAAITLEPDERYLQEELGPRADRYLGARKSGFFWDRWLREYYRDRVPVEVTGGAAEGLMVSAGPGLLPQGGRRAGLLAHDYQEQLKGIAARQHTGWLSVDERGAVYAPHTEQGFRAPANKTLLLLANGLLAKRGLRKAERDGTLERLRAASRADG